MFRLEDEAKSCFYMTFCFEDKTSHLPTAKHTNKQTKQNFSFRDRTSQCKSDLEKQKVVFGVCLGPNVCLFVLCFCGACLRVTVASTRLFGGSPVKPGAEASRCHGS